MPTIHEMAQQSGISEVYDFFYHGSSKAVHSNPHNMMRMVRAYGTLLGYPITVIRAKGAPAVSKYLMATHVGALLHAAILLGLVWASRLSTLGPDWHDVAAWLVVVSSALIAAKDTVNWLTGVQDEFGEKAKTAPLGALGASGETVGVGIFVVGILTAL